MEGEISCTVEESNRLRLKLGLKPLRVEEPPTNESNLVVEDSLKTKTVRLKIEAAKKQRSLHSNRGGVSLGDGENLSTADWIAKSKDVQNSKLEEAVATSPCKDVQNSKLEEAVATSPCKVVPAAYSAKDLAGISISHDLQALVEGGEDVVLTLKDAPLIDAETGELAEDVDELENVKLSEHARNLKARNTINKRKRIPMIPTAGEDALEDIGVLSKYDKVLEEEGLLKKPRLSTPKGHLDETGSITTVTVNEIVKQKLEQNMVINNTFKQMQDYMTADEYDVLGLSRKKKKTKKPKKEKKLKEEKKDASDDEIVIRKKKTKKLFFREDYQDEDDIYGQIVPKSNVEFQDVTSLISSTKEDSTMHSGLIISSATSFSSIMETRSDAYLQDKQERKLVQKTDRVLIKETSIEEPKQYKSGMAATLQMLKEKGTLGDKKPTVSSIIVGRQRDERPSVDEDGGVVLEYRDDQGRLLTTKEAFRQLSHKFHGIRPGYKKLEKRNREIERQTLLNHAAQDDSPLGMSKAMRKIQQSSGSAHIVLGSSKR